MAIGGVIIIIIVAMFFVLSLLGGSQNTPPTTTVSPTPQSIYKGPIELISSNPSEKATDVPLSIKPTFSFNTELETLNPQISISPNVPNTFSFTGKTITINPQSSLTPATNYVITVSMGNQNFFTSFTTTGGSPTLGPDTRPVDIIDEEQEVLKNSRPDVYLSNSTPFSNTDISVTSSFISAPTGHFLFTVKGTQAQFTTWAKSKGLSDLQITSLDVIYQ